MLFAHAASPLAISIELIAVAVLCGLALLYVRAVRRLGARGWRVPRLQVCAFAVGVVLVLGGLAGPLPRISDDLLLAHMAQHLLIADLAAPLILIGLRSPVMFFLWPRPILVRVARVQWLRTAASTVTHPAIGLPLWLATLVFWHLPPLFTAAVQNEVVHAAQHLSFWATAILVWWPLVEPSARRTPGTVWKVAHVFGARMTGGFVGVAMIAIPYQVYADAYGSRSIAYGIAPLTDQQIAGSMMMMVDVAIILGGFLFFLMRSGSDHDAAHTPAGSRQRDAEAPNVVVDDAEAPAWTADRVAAPHP